MFQEKQIPIVFKFIVKVSQVLESITRKLILLFMSVMVILVALNVVTRYTLGSSIGASYELSIHSYIYTVYLGTALALKKRAHPKMKYLYNKIKGKPKKVIIFINFTALIVLMAFFTVFGFMETIDKWGINAKMFEYPLGIIFFAVPFCGIITLFFIGEILIKGFYYDKEGEGYKWW